MHMNVFFLGNHAHKSLQCTDNLSKMFYTVISMSLYMIILLYKKMHHINKHSLTKKKKHSNEMKDRLNSYALNNMYSRVMGDKLKNQNTNVNLRHELT